MNKKIVVTRPFDKSNDLIDYICADIPFLSQNDFLVSPLLEVTTINAHMSDHEIYDALIITSANALHILKGRQEWLSKPIYIVGYNSSQYYKNIGGIGELFVFETARQMSRELAKSSGGFFLYLRGRDISVDMQCIEGISVKEKICYEAAQVNSLSTDVIQAINNHDVGCVLLFSKRTAETFSHIIKGEKLEHNISSIQVLCMSSQVATGLPSSFSGIINVANRPNEQGMIDLLRSTVVV